MELSDYYVLLQSQPQRLLSPIQVLRRIHLKTQGLQSQNKGFRSRPGGGANLHTASLTYIIKVHRNMMALVCFWPPSVSRISIFGAMYDNNIFYRWVEWTARRSRRFVRGIRRCSKKVRGQMSVARSATYGSSRPNPPCCGQLL